MDHKQKFFFLAVSASLVNFGCVKKSDKSATKSAICLEGAEGCTSKEETIAKDFKIGDYWNDFGIKPGRVHADDLIFSIPVIATEPKESKEKATTKILSADKNGLSNFFSGIGKAVMAPIKFGNKILHRIKKDSPTNNIKVHDVDPSQKILGYCWYVAPLIKAQNEETPMIDWSNAAFLAPDILSREEVIASKEEVVKLAVEESKEALQNRKDITNSGLFGLSLMEIEQVEAIFDATVDHKNGLGNVIFSVFRKPILNFKVKLAVKDLPDYTTKALEKLLPLVKLASKNSTVLKVLDEQSRHKKVDGWLVQRTIDLGLGPTILQKFETDNNRDSEVIAKELLNPLLGLESGIDLSFEPRELTAGSGVKEQNQKVFKAVAEAVYLAGWKKGALDNLVVDTTEESETKKRDLKNWFAKLKSGIKKGIDGVVGKEIPERAGYCTNRTWISESAETALEIKLTDAANRW